MVSNFIYKDEKNYTDLTYNEAKERCKNKCRDYEKGTEIPFIPPCKYYNIEGGTNVNGEKDSVGNFQGVVSGKDNYYKCFMTESTNTMCGGQTGDYLNLCNNIFDNEATGDECWKDMNNNCVKLTKSESKNTPLKGPWLADTVKIQSNSNNFFISGGSSSSNNDLSTIVNSAVTRRRGGNSNKNNRKKGRRSRRERRPSRSRRERRRSRRERQRNSRKERFVGYNLDDSGFEYF